MKSCKKVSVHRVHLQVIKKYPWALVIALICLLALADGPGVLAQGRTSPETTAGAARVPEELTLPPKSPSRHGEEAAGNQVLTLVVKPDCDLEPLARIFSILQASGDLVQDPVKDGDKFRLVTTAERGDWLRGERCVVDVQPGWRPAQDSVRASDGDQVPPANENPGAIPDRSIKPDESLSPTATGGISGAVIDQASGLPLPDISVEVYHYPGPEIGWTLLDSTVTNSSGAFLISNLVSGLYRVGFFDLLAGTFVAEYFEDVFWLYNALNVPVEDGITTANINAELSEPGQIRGSVTADDGGEALAGIYVDAYRAYAGGWEFTKTVTTNIDGAYLLDGLPSGTYRLYISDTTGRFLAEYYDGAANFENGTDVNVVGGATTSAINAGLATAAHITGTVTAEDGGGPLPNVQIGIYEYNGSYWDTVATAFTDDSGSYDAGGLRGGTYRIQFRDWSGGFVTEYYDDQINLESAVDVILPAGDTASGINAALTTAAHISGTVTAETGSGPLPNIEVSAYYLNGNFWDYAGYYYTDEHGNYNIGGLRGGTYRLLFYDWSRAYVTEYFDDRPDLDSATDIIVGTGITAAGTDAELTTAAHITGTVTAEDGGAPIAGIEVAAYEFNGSNWNSVVYVYTDENGYFDAGGLRGGTYRLLFRDWSGGYLTEYYDNRPDLDSAMDIMVGTGSTAAGTNAALATAGHITGTVTAEADGTPLPNIGITVWRFNDDYWEESGYGYSDAYGFYDVGGLIAGTYQLRFWDYAGAYGFEYYDNVFDLSGATNIPVSAGGTTSGIDAALAAGGRINGTVTAESNGLPLAGITVWLYRYVNGEWVYQTLQVTDDFGWYELGGLAAGTYRVEFYDWNGVYEKEVYDNATSLYDGTDLPVTAGGAVTGIDAALLERGLISGRVTAAGGIPLAGIDVGAWYTNGFDWYYLKSGFTDTNGDYTITGLEAGIYRVDFFDWNGSYRYEFYDDAPDVVTATDVIVTAATTTSGINATLNPAAHTPFINCVSNTGSDASIAVPSTVTILGGLNLESDDEFAIFTADGSICAGHGVWTGASLGLTAWGDNEMTAEKDGLTDGEAMRWAIWDASTNVVYDQVVVDYSVGDGLFANNSVHVVGNLDVTPRVSHDIVLSAGWNLISTFVEASNPAVTAILSDIVDEVVLMKNDDGQVYWPALNIDNIGNWDVRSGYQINMTDPAMLSITGKAIDPAATSIQLGATWNTIAYLRQTPLPVEQALASIDDGSLYLAKNGAGKVYWPAFGVNQIGDMQPGQGYQLYLSSAGTLVYPVE